VKVFPAVSIYEVKETLNPLRKRQTPEQEARA